MSETKSPQTTSFELPGANAGGAELHRGLKTRHITMISLGGTIGTGLYLASGATIAQAGAAGALLAYFSMGVLVYFMISSLGEMATYMPVTGSFSTYASRFVDPAFGFALGWNYWYSWATTVAVELTAAGLVMKYWFPNVDPIVWSAICLVLLFGLNMTSVKGYGEAEYWFSLIKVVTVLIFIVLAVLVAAGILGGHAYGFENWKGGQAFHGGVNGLFSVFLAAAFSFQGTELVGITAGESKSPRKDVPKAVNQVFWRILIFYVSCIFLIGLIVRFDDKNLLGTSDDIGVSPFTLVFTKAGMPGAADVMNGIILITVLSAGNSGLYAASRVLLTLAQEGKAPRVFARINRHGVPYMALIATTLVGCLTFFCSVIGSGTVYMWLLALSTVSGLIVWVGIAIAHYRFRKAYVAQGRFLEDLPYRARFYPLGPILAITLLTVIIIGQGYSTFTAPKFNWMNFITAYIGIPFFLALYGGYKIVKHTKVVAVMEMDLDSGRQLYLVEQEKAMRKREKGEQRASAGNIWEKVRQSKVVRALDWL